MSSNERIRKSISATLAEIERAPWQWQQLGDVVEALQIIARIEARLNNLMLPQANRHDVSHETPEQP